MATDYREILRLACDEAIEKFKPVGEVTKCNLGLNYIAEKMGYHGFKGLLANDIVAKLQKDPDFAPVPAEEVSRMANNGVFVIAGAFGQPHGHVATVVPTNMPCAISAKWKGKPAPWIANCGQEKSHGKVTANWAFKDQPRYWAWVRDPGEGD